MDCKNRIIKLRESTGLNRKDFCKLVHIPYRTMTEWELDNRHAPDYVLRLLEYYILHANQVDTKILHELQRVQNIGCISAKSGELKDNGRTGAKGS